MADVHQNYEDTANNGATQEKPEQATIQKSQPASDEPVKDEAEKRTTSDPKPTSESQADTDDTSKYRWCKCFIDAPQNAQNYYFMHFDTRETKYEEPTEPYWVWDAVMQSIHPSGLQSPSGHAAESKIEPANEEYQGYNPKIHGNYDPNAPYAQYHKQQRMGEDANSSDPAAAALAADGGSYTTVGAFNRFTGSFQTGEKSTERHNDYNKSGRQLGAFFDVDTAANSHDGRSLKEERRNHKLTKKQAQEYNQRRKEKKEKRRREYLMS